MPVRTIFSHCSRCRWYRSIARSTAASSASWFGATKAKAGGGVRLQRLGSAIDDRVGQAAGGPDHGRRAVPQTIQLVEPRRLVQARHEEEVGPRLDLVGQPLVEAECQADPARDSGRVGPSAGVVVRVALAEDDELGVRVRRKIVGAALRIRSTPFCSTSRATTPSSGVSRLLRQAELLLQRRLAARLACARRSRRRSARKVRVVGRVPDARNRRR